MSRSRIGSSQSLSAAQEMALLWLKQPLLVHLDFKRHKNYGFFCEVEIKILSRNVIQIVDLFLFPPQFIYWRFSTTSISLCRTSHLAEIKISRARCFLSNLDFDFLIPSPACFTSPLLLRDAIRRLRFVANFVIYDFMHVCKIQP